MYTKGCRFYPSTNLQCTYYITFLKKIFVRKEILLFSTLSPSFLKRINLSFSSLMMSFTCVLGIKDCTTYFVTKAYQKIQFLLRISFFLEIKNNIHIEKILCKVLTYMRIQLTHQYHVTLRIHRCDGGGRAICILAFKLSVMLLQPIQQTFHESFSGISL